MPEQNLFEELKSVLTDFKEFLDQNVPTIRPAINAIAGMIPQINDLIDQLAQLLGRLKTEITNLDVSAIPGLGEVASFTEKTSSLLDAARKLVPDLADEIDAIGDVADVVTGLPSLDQVKAEILALLDAVIAHINSLKSA